MVMVPTQPLIISIEQHRLITLIHIIITSVTFITLIMTDRTAERITGTLTGGMLTLT